MARNTFIINELIWTVLQSIPFECIAVNHMFLQVLHVQSLPRQCRALAASPNVCCLITCHPDGNNSNGTRLLVHDLPMHFEDGSTEAAHALSLRQAPPSGCTPHAI